MLIDLLFGCATAFGDSDDGGIDLDNDLPDNSNEPDEPGSMDDPSPPVTVAYPQPHPPFEMVDFMHNSSSYDMHKGLSFISNRQRRKEGTFCASGLAGIEPTPPAPEETCTKYLLRMMVPFHAMLLVSVLAVKPEGQSWNQVQPTSPGLLVKYSHMPQVAQILAKTPLLFSRILGGNVIWNTYYFTYFT
jgi:hypothetical protein